jgi:hypothetical protein
MPVGRPANATPGTPGSFLGSILDDAGRAAEENTPTFSVRHIFFRLFAGLREEQ